MTDIIDSPSPSFNDRIGPVKLVILHYTGMRSGPDALARLTDEAAQVSSHYFIEQDGTVHRLVAEEKRAWHAGRGAWGEITDVNDASVGIEIVNRGHLWGLEPYPDAQIDALVDLLKGILSRHSLGGKDVIGHSDIAPERKDDPGELFPWDRLAAEGLALPQVDVADVPEGLDLDTVPTYEEAIALLQAIGYHTTLAAPIAATLAFQRRFMPGALADGLSPRTRWAIAVVAASLTRQ